MKVPLLLITLAISMTAVIALRDFDTVQLGGRNYYFGKYVADWYNAQKSCRSNNLTMVALETPEENKLIVEYSQANYGDTWLDGTDVISEGRWRWNTTGQAINYTNWLPGTPNGGTRENCLFIIDKDVTWGTWSDHECIFMKVYVCEEKSQ